jgi:hypothetical protein
MSAIVTLGTETLVNTTTVGDQSYPALATISDGGYVVTWNSYTQDGSGYGIYAQRYDASGNAIGGETLVNTTTLGDQKYPAVAGLSDGGYVVTWESYNLNTGSDVYAQLFDANGTAIGSETLVNTTTPSGQAESAVAALSDGGYIITWDSNVQDGSGFGIYAQRYDASGNAIGGETRINTTTVGDQSAPATRSVTTLETRTSSALDCAMTRAAACTAIPPISRPLISISPV